MELAEGVVLQLLQQEQFKQLGLANQVCQIILNSGTYGDIFGMGAMAWHLLDDNNKMEVKNYIQNSQLKIFATKFLILIEVAEYVPKMNMTVEIPEKFKPVLDLFQVDPATEITSLHDALNSHIGTLIQSLKNKEASVGDTLKQIGTLVVNQAYQKAQSMGVNVMAIARGMMANMGSSMMTNMSSFMTKGGRKSRRKRKRKRRSLKSRRRR
jgi:hypothetical protein